MQTLYIFAANSTANNVYGGSILSSLIALCLLLREVTTAPPEGCLFTHPLFISVIRRFILYLHLDAIFKQQTS